MNLLYHFSIKSRLLVGYSFPLIALISLTFLALSGLHKVQLSAQSMYLDKLLPMQHLKNISDNYAVSVVDAVNKGNAGLWTGEEVSRSAKAAKAEIAIEWNLFLESKLSDKGQQLASEAEALFDDANTQIDALLSSLARPEMRGSVFRLLDDYDGRLYSVIDPITEKIGELSILESELAQGDYAAINAEYETDKVLFITVSATVFLITLIIGFVTYLSIKSPLDKIAKTIKTAAENSDLTLACDLSGQNELSDISENFNTMMARFREVVRRIHDVTDRLASSSEELTTVGGQSSAAIQLQSDELRMVVTAVTEMLATSQDIAANASTADQEAIKTENAAQEGAKVVAAAVHETFVLIERLGEVSEKIRSLESEGNSIATILNVITSIAEQTNLLALNAAIEAARAGDQGRGFAVVADEVRTLAKRTQDSTAEIEHSITRLQSETEEAVSAATLSRVQAEKTGDEAKRAGDALKSVIKAVSVITSMNAQIATASEQQTQVSEEINRSLVRISDSSEEVAGGANQIAQASEELSSLALNLSGLVSTFKS